MLNPPLKCSLIIPVLIVMLAATSAHAADKPAGGLTASGHTKDSLETVQKRIAAKKAVLVDVREKREWTAGHLKSATFVPLSVLRLFANDKEFAQKLAKKIPKKKIVYLHCRSGRRVLVAAPILKKMGYDVRPLRLGYQSLLQAGFEKAK
ncbi:MAG: hypothetical protein Tsb009_39590 [Planctomycetaceae bacterium]